MRPFQPILAFYLGRSLPIRGKRPMDHWLRSLDRLGEYKRPWTCEFYSTSHFAIVERNVHSRRPLSEPSLEIVVLLEQSEQEFKRVGFTELIRDHLLENACSKYRHSYPKWSISLTFHIKVNQTLLVDGNPALEIGFNCLTILEGSCVRLTWQNNNLYAFFDRSVARSAFYSRDSFQRPSNITIRSRLTMFASLRGVERWAGSWQCNLSNE